MVEHGRMFARSRQPFAARKRKRVRLRAAGREDHLLRPGAREGRNPGPGFLDETPRGAALAMYGGRIPEHGHRVRHGVPGNRRQRRGGVPVQVNAAICHDAAS